MAFLLPFIPGLIEVGEVALGVGAEHAVEALIQHFKQKAKEAIRAKAHESLHHLENAVRNGHQGATALVRATPGLKTDRGGGLIHDTGAYHNRPVIPGGAHIHKGMGPWKAHK